MKGLLMSAKATAINVGNSILGYFKDGVRTIKPLFSKALRRWRILLSLCLVWLMWNPLWPDGSIVGWTFKGGWLRILSLYDSFLSASLGTQAIAVVAAFAVCFFAFLFIFPSTETGRRLSLKRAFWFGLVVLVGLLCAFLLEQKLVGILKFLVFFGTLGVIFYVFKRAHVGLKMLGMFFLAVLLAAICYFLVYIEWVTFGAKSIAAMANICVGLIAGIGLESIRWDRKVSGMGTVMAEAPSNNQDDNDHHSSSDDADAGHR